MNYKSFTSLNSIKRISYRNDINGLRALAVIAVILYHLDNKYLVGGYLGVDMFFVISGYLISNIIFSDINENNFSLKNFYFRRVRRILPSVISTILFSFPIAYFVLLPNPTLEYLTSIIFTVFFISNVYFSELDFYNSEPAELMPFLHTWSLGIEEQFYLLFPLLTFILFKKMKQKFIFVLFILFSLSLYLNIGSTFEKFYLLQYRAWQLFAGVLLCIFSQKLRIKYLDIIGLGIIFYCLYTFNDLYILEIEPRLLITFGVALIIFGDNENSVTAKLSSTKIVNNLGLTSFSLYLFHQPIFSLGRIYANKTTILLGNIQDPSYFSNLIFEKYLPYFVILLFIISNLNYKYIESKFLDNTYSISKLFLPTIFVLLVSFIGLYNEGYKLRFNNLPENVLEYIENETNQLSIDNDLCWERKIIENICVFSRNSENSIYIFGDSHAATLSLNLVTNKNLQNFNFYDITGCIKYIEYIDPNYKCEEIGYVTQPFNSFLKNIKNSLVIYFINTDLELKKYELDQFQKYIDTTLNTILQNNNKLILVYPVPIHPFGVPEQFIQNDLDFFDTVSMPIDYFVNNKNKLLAYQIYDSLENVNIYRIYPEEIFCNSFVKYECVGAFDGSLFYYDTDHLSKDGANLVVKEIVNIINSIGY